MPINLSCAFNPITEPISDLTQTNKFDLIYWTLFFSLPDRNAIQDTAKTCITYDAINAAYLDARKRIRKYFQVKDFKLAVGLQMTIDWYWLSRNRTDVSQPKGEWKTEDIATVGELLLDISIQLART